MTKDNKEEVADLKKNIYSCAENMKAVSENHAPKEIGKHPAKIRHRT